MNLYEQAVVPGDIIEVIDEREYYRMNSNTRIMLRPGMALMVTTIFRESVNARTVDRIRNRFTDRMENMTFSLSKATARLLDPNAPRPPAPRKLGTKPEGEEFIGVDHPGIQWLFDDMGAYADKQGWCPQYDTLCVRLGIPGRPRDFTVTKTINGIEVKALIKARSQREANEIVEKALAGRIPDDEPPTPEETPETTFAPAA